MVTRPDQRERAAGPPLPRALWALVEAGAGVAAADSLADALRAVAAAVARATGADAAVVRAVGQDHAGRQTSAVASASTAVAAELEGMRLSPSEIPHEEVVELNRASQTVVRAARRIRATAVLQVPVVAGDELVGSIELFRVGVPFDDAARTIAHLAATQAAVAVRALGDGGARGGGPEAGAKLALAGEALAAGADASQTAEHVTRLAVEATGAGAGLLWRREQARPLALVASHGLEHGEEPAAAREAAERALAARDALTVETVDEGLPGGARMTATLQLGQPALGALQLFFPLEAQPSGDDLARLTTFGVRAAHALRASIRSRAVAFELERTRALLGVVGQAIAELSLAHTLETAVARIAELLDADRVAVYLRGDEGLHAAAGVGLAGPHARFAERLLELTLRPFRGLGVVTIADVARDPRVAASADAAAEAGIDAAVAVPLRVHDEPFGLLALFPRRGQILGEHESGLLIALASQLAVAVQNAQLHEEAKRLVEERERALESERSASRQLRALYEISRSFAQSLSLDATLDAVASTIVELLDVDIAVIRVPDERRDLLVPRAMRVAETRLEEVARTLMWRPYPFGAQPIQRLFRHGEPYRLTSAVVRQIGPPATALVPFLERGWTGAVVPIATTAEVLASLTLISLRPGNAVTAQTIERATTIAGQAALAIDNARLYQQQKEFADTMQRSLLPRRLPSLPGLEVGHAYQSSARVEVGGDVYDFVELHDGRLGAVLGDVTGHGIDAAADMAMAKFAFRSLAREHPEPKELLRAVNEIVVEEIAPGKFITMVYLAVDGRDGIVSGAGAGHPQPRIVRADGTVEALPVGGLVLGIEPGQEYEEVRAPLALGDAVVLYTDGVLEARFEGELYGFERLDAIVSAGRELSAEDLAQTVLADCRDFSHNELLDDCAVVVIKRVAPS